MDFEKELSTAYQYQGQGVFDKALEHFTAAAGSATHRERAMLGLAKTYKMMNEPSRAIDAFIETLKEYPSNTEALKELGETSRIASRFERSLPFLEAFAADGKTAGAFLELGRIYVQARDPGRARAHIERFKALDPDNPEAGIVMSRILKKEGKLDLAIGALQEARRLSPDNRDAVFELGDAFYLKGDFKAAAEHFEKLTERLKNDKEVYLRLIELYRLLGNEAAQEEAAREVLRLTPADPFSQDSMLNEIEILRRKTVLASKVKRLWVSVTSRCNIKCKTCGLWHNKWDLPYEAAQEVMGLYPYLERVVWLGGEVFMYPHFEEMFDRATQFPNLKHQVITNGFILTERWIDKIISAPNTEFTFSIDGTTREVYESIRQGSNFEK
ncbi:MAG: tetratricopeptide repeat protein, partial [Endomicrobiales bacterium]